MSSKAMSLKGKIKNYSKSNELKEMWDKYRKKFAYASDISYENVMKALYNILE